MRRRCWVDAFTRCDDDPVCLALIEAHGSMTLEEIAQVLMRDRYVKSRRAGAPPARVTTAAPVTRERVRQIEQKAIEKLLGTCGEELRAMLPDDPRTDAWDSPAVAPVAMAETPYLQGSVSRGGW
jgi:hypothetical protein